MDSTFTDILNKHEVTFEEKNYVLEYIKNNYGGSENEFIRIMKIRPIDRKPTFNSINFDVVTRSPYFANYKFKLFLIEYIKNKCAKKCYNNINSIFKMEFNEPEFLNYPWNNFFDLIDYNNSSVREMFLRIYEDKGKMPHILNLFAFYTLKKFNFITFIKLFNWDASTVQYKDTKRKCNSIILRIIDSLNNPFDNFFEIKWLVEYPEEWIKDINLGYVLCMPITLAKLYFDNIGDVNIIYEYSKKYKYNYETIKFVAKNYNCTFMGFLDELSFDVSCEILLSLKSNNSAQLITIYRKGRIDLLEFVHKNMPELFQESLEYINQIENIDILDFIINNYRENIDNMAAIQIIENFDYSVDVLRRMGLIGKFEHNDFINNMTLKDYLLNYFQMHNIHDDRFDFIANNITF